MRNELSSGSGDGLAQVSGPDARLPRSRRVTRSPEFREAFDQGRRFVGRLMVLWVRRGENAGLRLGVVSSRKVGNAVCRAKARRRIREAFRLNRHRLDGAADLILVARQSIIGASPAAVEREFLYLAGKAGLHSGKERDHEKE